MSCFFIFKLYFQLFFNFSQIFLSERNLRKSFIIFILKKLNLRIIDYETTCLSMMVFFDNHNIFIINFLLDFLQSFLRKKRALSASNLSQSFISCFILFRFTLLSRKQKSATSDALATFLFYVSILENHFTFTFWSRLSI